MVQLIGGMRRKTRYKLQKERRDKGKISLRNYFATYNEGDRVILKAEPAIQKGMYHPRFHGRTAEVVSKRGDCYVVKTMDKDKQKQVIVHPVHMKRG